MNNKDNANLIVKIVGPAPDRHEISAYDIGTILISLQRLVRQQNLWVAGRPWDVPT
jgi:hypothetical protein